MHRLAKIIFVFLVLCLPPQVFARGGGGGGGGGSVQLGIGGGLTSSTQDHMNTLISRANTRIGGITTGSMNSAYEFVTQIGYRYSGSMIALMFRPSYFYQVAKGSGSGGSYNYGVQGYTLFPMLRLYPLENDFMKFYMHFGLGFGQANGSIEEATAKAEFSGNAFGTILGLGSEFCFLGGAHCAFVEGNYRYLTMERNIGTSYTGTFASNSITGSKGGEIEMDNADFQTRMGGVQFLLGYAFYF
jgi:hypothetical protein